MTAIRLFGSDIFNSFNVGALFDNSITLFTALLIESLSVLFIVVEPFLLKIGFLLRTAQGRKLTNIAYEQIGKNPPMNHQNE